MAVPLQFLQFFIGSLCAGNKWQHSQSAKEKAYAGCITVVQMKNTSSIFT